VVILVAIVFLSLAACVEFRYASPALPKPTMYYGGGAGPASLTRLAQDKVPCFQEAELTDPYTETWDRE
jgi:hypothetical protein